MEDLEARELLKELNKSIDDMENGHVTAHEDTMRIETQRYIEYVAQKEQANINKK